MVRLEVQSGNHCTLKKLVTIPAGDFEGYIELRWLENRRDGDFSPFSGCYVLAVLSH